MGINTDKLEITKSTPLELLGKHGVSRDDFAKCLKGGLSAERVIKDKYGDEVERLADWNVRHKFLATGLEWIKELNGQGTVVMVSQDVKEAQEAYNRWRSVGTG